MPITSENSGFVTLPDGIVVPATAALLAIELERRGCHLSLDADVLVVRPRGLLTDEDRALIRRWKEPLKAIVAHACALGAVQ